MAKFKRHKTNYPGVFYLELSSGTRPERVYYIRYKRAGRLVEEKAGGQYRDDMTPARANRIRTARIEGRELSNTERRSLDEELRRAEAGRPTFERLWADYKENRPSSRSLYVDDRRFELHLKPSFGNKTPLDIVTLDVDRVRLRMLKTHSPQTVRHCLALLRRIIGYAVKRGLCAAPDPSRLHIELPALDNCRTEDLSPEQMAALIEAAEMDEHPDIAGIIKLALTTGMRRSELLKLEWRDLDFDRGFITLRAPKGGKTVSIPMSEAARAVLLGIPRKGSPLVFSTEKGTPYQNITAPLRRVRDRAGLPKDFRPLHGCRHAFASMLASSGEVDLYTLQRLLTHKSPQMTQRYAHLRDEALRRASELAGSIVSTATAAQSSAKAASRGGRKGRK